MTTDGFLILKTLISECWRFFTSWHYPGTHASPGEMGLFILTVYVSFKFFKRVGRVEDSSAGDKD